jgi:hypothetical protein
MTIQLGAITPTLKTGEEPFHEIGKPQGFNLIDFWRWSASDLITNTARGVLAEFIVAKALGIANGVRSDWGAYDLEMPTSGKILKIEVKSKAYLQSWEQDKLVENPLFVVKKSKPLDSDQGKYVGEPIRQSDIYVFALLAEKEKTKLDPLDIGQWNFYVLHSSVLNGRTRSQHSITLKSLEALPEIIKSSYYGLKDAVISASKQT